MATGACTTKGKERSINYFARQRGRQEEIARSVNLVVTSGRAAAAALFSEHEDGLLARSPPSAQLRLAPPWPE
jgi:hypothetical protein